MKVLVTGANGFVGKNLCEALCRQNFSVIAAARSASLTNSNVQWQVVGNIDGNSEWGATLVGVDVIIHLAARVHVMQDSVANPLAEFRKVNVDGTLNLARQAAMKGVKRFIFVSSVKVNGEYTEAGRPFSEDDVADPHDAYGISKLEAETGLDKLRQEIGMEVVIIRPVLVYGEGVQANFANMIKNLKNGTPLPFGAIDNNKRSFVYVENLVSLIVACIDHPLAKNQVFLVSDGCDLSTTELLKACADALGVKVRLFYFPQKLIEILAGVLGKQAIAQRLCGNLQVSISKAETLLGWTPPYSVKEGLKRTANGFNDEFEK